jgi:surface polysaccharide O-acyltransferase-like enzyme
MITGATLIDYRERCSLKDFFIRRLKRAVAPFFICSAVAFFVYAPWQLTDWASLSFYRQFIHAVLDYQYMSAYWFFYPLFALYLSIPVLAQIEDKIKTFTYMIIYGGITLVIIPFIARLIDWNSPLFAIAAPVCGAYVLYMLLGYVLNNCRLPKVWRLTIYIAGIVGTLTRLFGDIYGTPPGGPFTENYRGYMNLPAMLQAVAIFLFIKETEWQKLPTWVSKLVNLIKPHTLGIYLLHMYFIESAPAQWYPTLLFRTLGAIIIFILSLIASALLAQIPVISAVLGKGSPQWLKKIRK